MATRGPARPPTFRWESDCDWSGRPFPSPGDTEPAPVTPTGEGLDAAEVTLPLTAATTASRSGSPSTGQSGIHATNASRAFAPSDIPGTFLAPPAHTRATPPEPAQPAQPADLSEPAEPEIAVIDPVAEEFVESEESIPIPAEEPRSASAPVPGQVLAEDVFVGLLDDPVELGGSAASTGEHPAEVAEATELVVDGLALTDPDGAALVVPGNGASVARQVWSRVCHVAPGLAREDATAAVASGELAYLRALIDPRGEVRDRAGAHAGQAAERSATRMVAVLSRGSHDPAQPRGRASWQRAGTVIPVLGAGAGVGASVTAAAVFDALDAAGIPTLLVDAAEPARSGLSRATGHPGNAADRRPHPDVGIAFAPRGGGWVAALSAPADELLTDALVPDPSWWLPLRTTPAVTVVDLGWDPWQTAATPLRGAGVWLEDGDPPPRPLLVTTATRPGVFKVRELLDRLRPWCDRGLIAAPAGLVVTGARRWPREVRPVAVRQLGALAEQAVLLPHDRSVALGGVGPDMVPARLRTPFAPVLRRWGLPVNAVPALGRFLRGH